MRPLQSLRIPAREGDDGQSDLEEGYMDFQWHRRVDGSACPLHRRGVQKRRRDPQSTWETYGSTVFLQRGEGIPNEREHLQEYSVPGSREGVGLLTCAPMAACRTGLVSPPLKCLHPGGLLRGSGNNHKLSLLAFPGFSLGDGNLCDFPMRAFAGARNEKVSHLWPPVAFSSTSRERGQVSGIMVPA